MKCKLCRAPFFSTGSSLCPACQEQTDRDFIVVRDYIYDHPQHVGMDEIAEATGVSEKTIIYLLQEERLTATDSLNIKSDLRCQLCGKAISSGSICSSCKASLTKDLSQAASALAVDDKKSIKRSADSTRGSRDFYSISTKK
ncbi:MAG: flagellar protein [Clostridiales bacterium]|nr:flagellar protein [Clostridiales bacterium]